MSDQKTSGPRGPKGGGGGGGGRNGGGGKGGGTGSGGPRTPGRPGAGRGDRRDAGAPGRPTAPRSGAPARPGSPARAGGPARPGNPARPGGPSRAAGPSRDAGPARSGAPARPGGPKRPGAGRSGGPARPRNDRGADRNAAGRSRPSAAPAGDGPDWLYGAHAVRAALQNPARRVLRLVATKNASEFISEPARLRGVQIEITDGHDIDQLFMPGTVHQGVALRVAPLPEPVLADVLKPSSESAEEDGDKPLIILDQVTDPQNVGAVLRSAAVFGARAVIVTRRNSPPITGALAKAASGAVEQMPLVQVPNVAQAIAVLQAEGWFAVGLEGTGEKSLGSVDLTGKIVLVMGAEGVGLRRLTAERCDMLARIPGDAGFASLNVSNAAAVALYEISRQRGR